MPNLSRDVINISKEQEINRLSLLTNINHENNNNRKIFKCIVHELELHWNLC